MVSFCNGNVTSISPRILDYKKEMNNNNLDNALLVLKDVIRFYQGSFFNCFYTIFDPLGATKIRRDYDINVFLWNILFNFGSFYTDFKNLYLFVTYQKPAAGKDTRTWETFGKYFADIIFHILYSRYRAKAYFPIIPQNWRV